MNNKSLLIKNIRHLVTCDENDNLLENVNMFVENGEIKYIGAEVKEADTVIDASHMAVFPGLVNTHHHLYQILTRNLPQVQNLELFPWLKALYTIWKNINADSVYISSKSGLGELLKSGCTTCADHHYVFPKDCGDLLEAQFTAASHVGIRMVSTRGSMSLSEKDGGLPPDSVVQTVDEILLDSQRVVEKFHDSKKFSMRQVVLAPCSPFSVTEDLMIETSKLARSLGVRFHTHLAETMDEENFVIAKQGMRPLAYMEKLGWVGSDVWYAHGIYFNDEELKLLADTKTGVAHCPVSNMKLSSGIAKIPQMLKLGVPVGLAVDGSASNDGSNMLEEMRVCYLLHRLSSSTNAPSGYDILKMATVGGASILGRNDIGRLKVGMAADFFMVRENRLELAGATFDVKSMLCTVGLYGCVDYTVVNGEVVVKDGHLVNEDEAKLSEAVTKTALEIMNK